MEIDILVDEQYLELVDPAWLEEISRRVLTAQQVPENTEMGLVITTQERVHELNRDYRGLDEPTDVLSFYMNPEEGEETPDAVPFLTVPDINHIGEVIISYPQAAKQALEHNHSAKWELIVLTVHGILHLLGFDHCEREEELEMQTREKDILLSLEGLR